MAVVPSVFGMLQAEGLEQLKLPSWDVRIRIRHPLNRSAGVTGHVVELDTRVSDRMGQPLNQKGIGRPGRERPNYQAWAVVDRIELLPEVCEPSPSRAARSHSCWCWREALLWIRHACGRDTLVRCT